MMGGRPVRISVSHDPGDEPLAGLIIGGGDDIGPEHYGGDLSQKVRGDPDRDALEIAWIRRALVQRLPLLGICRGAQLINVVKGGSLHQDIRPMRRKTSNRPGLLPTKEVVLAENSLLAQVCAKMRLRVNSLHHQAIDRPGYGVNRVAQDRDGIVQAIEGEGEQLFIGVQWHPEYLIYLPSSMRLFRWLVRMARVTV